MRICAHIRTQTPPKCFSSASGNCSSCFRSSSGAPFSQASRWRAGNSQLIKCLENPPPSPRLPVTNITFATSRHDAKAPWQQVRSKSSCPGCRASRGHRACLPLPSSFRVGSLGACHRIWNVHPCLEKKTVIIFPHGPRQSLPIPHPIFTHTQSPLETSELCWSLMWQQTAKVSMCGC